MKTLLAFAGHPFSLAVMLVLTAFVSFRLGSCGKVRDPIPQVDTLYIDRPLVERDTVNVYYPVRVTVYDSVEVLRTDTVRVPVDFNYTGLVGRNPVTLDRSKFILTSFDTQKQAFTQRTYHVPDKKWGLSLNAVTTLTNAYTGIGLELGLRYRRVTVRPITFVQVSKDGDLRLVYGISGKYNLF